MSVSKRLRFRVLERDEFRCVYCGACPPDTTLHVDHVKPRSKGGTDEMHNLVTACSICNLGKGARWDYTKDPVFQYMWEEDPGQVATCDPDFFPPPVL